MPLSEVQKTESEHEDASSQANTILLEPQKQFAHSVLGGVPFVPSKLEGTTAGMALEQFISDVKRFQDETGKDMSSVIEMFTDSLELVRQYDNPNIPLDTIKRLIKTKAEGLEAGKKIIYPAGIGGHLYLFEITKQDNGKLTIKLFNAGEGVEYHPTHGFPIPLFQEKKYQTFKVQDIDLNKVDTIIDTIVVGEQQPSPIPFIAQFIDMYRSSRASKRIYTTLKDAGTEVRENPKLKPEAFHKLQRHGFCAAKCYTLWLRENKNYETYAKFKAERTQYALDNLRQPSGATDEKIKGKNLKSRIFRIPTLASLSLFIPLGGTSDEKLHQLGVLVLARRREKAQEAEFQRHVDEFY